MTQEEYIQYIKTHSCYGCPAFKNLDCTRNPYTEGCLDPIVEQYWKEYKIKEGIMDGKIEIGDEVYGCNKKGEPLLDTRFIVTYTDTDSIHGIDFAGKPYIYSSNADLRKTGRHYDITGALLKLRDEG